MTEIEKLTRRHAKGGGAKFAYDQLKGEILSLTLRPVPPLDETGLSERFAMSRSPIREALVRLPAEGLVVALSNHSTLAAPIGLAGFPRHVEALDFLQRINTRLAARNRKDDEIKRFHNPRRRNSKLGHLSPMEFEVRATPA